MTKNYDGGDVIIDDTTATFLHSHQTVPYGDLLELQLMILGVTKTNDGDNSGRSRNGEHA